MKKLLNIAKDIILPLDTVTQAIAILAKRRAGKSYTMRRIVEQLLEAHQQIVLVDPKGDQWGIRSSADGKKPGFPVLILGGEHGDLPLEVTAGETIANLVVKEQVNVLLDISLFRKHEVATFMTAFLENLYRLKAQEQYRTPLMLIIDEADAIAPQKPEKNETRMLGAANDIVRRGGQRGIGCTLVTQRSAVLNKNVLTQCELIIALRTVAPQDLAAMKAWIDVHGTIEQGKELMDSLPSLPIGDAWFWSPGWPTDKGIFKRAHVASITTFDSGATPKVGEKPKVPKNLADVDLETLREQMAATIEKAKKDDPKLLRQRIAELEKAQKIPSNLHFKQKNVGNDPKDTEKAVSTAIAKRDKEWEERVKKERALWKSEVDKFYGVKQRLQNTIAVVGEPNYPLPHRPQYIIEIGKDKGKISSFGVLTPDSKPLQLAQHDRNTIIGAINNDESPRTISGPEQKVLNALAWCESIGQTNPPNELVAFLSGYSHYRSTGYTNPRGYLKGKGFITYTGAGVALTTHGRQLAVTPTTPLTQEELHRAVLERLDGPERKILVPLLEKYPESISNTDLCTMAGYMHERSTGYTNPRGRLRSFGLVEYDQRGVKASSILFIS